MGRLVNTTEKITDFGKYLQNMMAQLKGKPYVKTGFPPNKFNTPHKQKKGSHVPISVGEVAVAMNFGTSTIPARPFLTGTAEATKTQMRAFMKREIQKIAKGESAPAESLSRIGAYQVGLIQKTISSNMPPPNSPATIARKGSSTTLIDSGQMRQTVTYEVTLPVK